MTKYRSLRQFAAVILIMLSILSSMLLAGCSGSSNDVNESETDLSAGTQQTDQDASTYASDDLADSGSVSDQDLSFDPDDIRGEDGVDVDLTELSATMVYSVVYDMLIKPNDYIGKTVRMSGTMSVYHDEESGNTYYACIIKDATACCAQGIEFIAGDEYSDALPEDGEEVTVVGRYDLYTEENVEYCVLTDAAVEP